MWAAATATEGVFVVSSTDDFFERVEKRALEHEALADAVEGRRDAELEQLARERETVARLIAIAAELSPRLRAAGFDPEVRVTHKREVQRRRLIGRSRFEEEVGPVYAEGWVLAHARAFITGGWTANDSRIGGMGRGTSMVLVETILGTSGQIHVFATADHERFNEYALPAEAQSRDSSRSDEKLWKPWSKQGVGLAQPLGSFGDSRAVITLTRPEQYPLTGVAGDTEQRATPFSPEVVERGLEELAIAALRA
jgi:hypothetical protein